MRLWKNGLFQLGLLLAAPFLIGALCLNSSFAVNQSTWNNKHITNYTMNIISLALPSPPVDIRVTVRNDKVIDEKLVACESGQTKYPVEYCKTLTTYYYAPGGRFTRTMNDLFQIAQSCTEKTKSVVDRYGIRYQIGFTGFTSSDALYDFESTYSASLQWSDFLCSVEYDAEYGYPKQIIQSSPNTMDGVGIISVENFHVDN